MDHYQQLVRQTRRFLFPLLFAENALLLAIVWAGLSWTHLSPLIILAIALGLAGILTLIIAALATERVLQPIKAVWQAIVHISPNQHDVAAPNIDSLSVGRELVASLSAQIYQLATVAEHSEDTATSRLSTDLNRNFIANNLPLPLFVLNAEQTIIFVNDTACKYLGLTTDDIVNKNVYSVLDMSFPNDRTFDKWLKMTKESAATASNLWERVRLNVSDNQPTRLFDLAAYYNKGNTQHYETMLVLFDHTKQYSQDDQAVSFIALSVHELRTPLTLLRGYIEAFEEEMHDKLSPELNDFMFKMNATAQQLSAFVNNILNVARVDDDQLVLELHEENWPDIIRGAANTMALRAQVRGITLKFSIAPNLPLVGVDRVSINEVINNLLDNAIKYSGQSREILLSTSLNSEGLIETTIQDWGVGVPTAVMPNLFTKFYRDHRNRAQIGGTGLGLYLSKAIVTAHGGNIWVRSKEGQGSTFGFTLLPYTKLAEEIKNSDNKEIVRGAHGWIKNHSLYRR